MGLIFQGVHRSKSQSSLSRRYALAGNVAMCNIADCNVREVKALILINGKSNKVPAPVPVMDIGAGERSRLILIKKKSDGRTGAGNAG